MPVGVPFFPYGAAISGRTPMLNQTDLSVFQDVDVETALQFGVTVLNLFDLDTVTRRDNTRIVSDLPVTLDQFFNGFDYVEGLLTAIRPRWIPGAGGRTSSWLRTKSGSR